MTNQGAGESNGYVLNIPPQYIYRIAHKAHIKSQKSKQKEGNSQNIRKSAVKYFLLGIAQKIVITLEWL